MSRISLFEGKMRQRFVSLNRQCPNLGFVRNSKLKYSENLPFEKRKIELSIQENGIKPSSDLNHQKVHFSSFTELGDPFFTFGNTQNPKVRISDRIQI